MKKTRPLLAALFISAVVLGTAACSAEPDTSTPAASPSASVAPSGAPADAPPAGGALPEPPGGAVEMAPTSVLQVAEVETANGDKVSAIVNDSGFTMYLLTGDSVEAPQCAEAECTAFWPRVVSIPGGATLGSGVAGEIGVWTHDGVDQLTLNGSPLYTFGGDSTPGTALGHGLTSNFGDGVWSLLAPDGTPVPADGSGS